GAWQNPRRGSGHRERPAAGAMGRAAPATSVHVGRHPGGHAADARRRRRAPLRRAPVRRRQNVVSEPSSRSIPDMGLNTDCVPDVLPPHRMPTSLTLLPLVHSNTGEPLSPPPTPAFTRLWQSCVMFVPLTEMFTQ